MSGCTKSSAIVVYRKQLGDMIILQPALRALAEQAGDVKLLTLPAFAPLIELMPGVRFASPGLLAAERLVSFSPKASAGFRRLTCWVRRSSVVITKARQERWWLRLFYDDIRLAETASQYRGKAFFDAVALPGQQFSPPALSRPPESWRPDGLPDRYVVIHPTSAWRRKCLSPQSWGKVMAEIPAGMVGDIVLTGGKEAWEREFCGELAGNLSGHRVHDFSGQTTLQGYLFTLANAATVLCVDSSASHAAAAFRVPTVTLFGPSNPLHWHCPTSSSLALAPPIGVSIDERSLLADLIPWPEIVASIKQAIFLPQPK